MVKVGKEFGGDIDPDDPDIAFRKHRWTYWAALKGVRIEWMESRTEFDVKEFLDYVRDTYGISANADNGMITDKWEVIDEQKYLIFLLKWL